MEGKVQFGNVDFAVFGVMLLLSTFIGIYHAFTGGRQRTTKEFLFANRGMMAIPVALSLLASFMSAITILGVPSEIYIFGTQYWLIIASYVILFPSVALIFVPVFRAVDISSSYEVSTGLVKSKHCRVMNEHEFCLRQEWYEWPFQPRFFFGFTNWLSYIFFYVLENFVMYFMNSSQFSLLWKFFYSLANLLIHVVIIDQSPLKSFGERKWKIREVIRLKYSFVAKATTLKQTLIWNILHPCGPFYFCIFYFFCAMSMIVKLIPLNPFLVSWSPAQPMAQGTRASPCQALTIPVWLNLLGPKVKKA